MGRKRSEEAEKRHIELGRQLGKAREAMAQPGSGKTRYLTQAALAKKLGWSTSMVAKMETGLATPNPLRLRQLANFYSKPLMPWLRLACGDELIDVILRADREEESAENQKSARKTRAAMKDNARAKAKTKANVHPQQNAAGARAEGVRLFRLAGSPTSEQFIRVYGESGPKMTWAQRAAAGVPAEKFQKVLAAKQLG